MFGIATPFCGILTNRQYFRKGEIQINISGPELKATARRLISENAPKVFFVSIIYIVIITVVAELQIRLPGVAFAWEQFLERLYARELPGFGTLFSFFRPSGAALAFVLMLMLPVIEAGYMSYCLKINREQGGEYKDILDGFLFFLKILLISIITAFFTILWSLLFIIPGIVASLRYSQAIYILLDDPGKSAMQCIRESKSLMAGHKLELFLVNFSFIGWMFVNYVVILLLPLPFSFPVISIWLTPYMGLTHAAYYDKLIGRLVV